MLTKEQAKEILLKRLNSPNAPFRESTPNDEIVIVDDATIEKEYGWIFFYNSKIFLETGNMLYSILGNIPLVVDKIDGSISGIQITWHKTFNDALKAYEAHRKNKG